MDQLWRDHEERESIFFIADDVLETSERKEELHDYELQNGISFADDVLDGFITFNPGKPDRMEIETFPGASEIPIPIENDIYGKQPYNNSYQQDCISYGNLPPPISNSNISDSSHDSEFLQQQLIQYFNPNNNPGPMIYNSYIRNYIPNEGIPYVLSTDDYASAMINNLAKQSPLPEKGKLLQAVTEVRLLPIPVPAVTKWQNPPYIPYNTQVSGYPDYASGYIHAMAKKQPLPENVEIQQAVIETRRLLDTVRSSSIQRTPIPRWQNVPPSSSVTDAGCGLLNQRRISNFVSGSSSTPKRKAMDLLSQIRAPGFWEKDQMEKWRKQ